MTKRALAISVILLTALVAIVGCGQQATPMATPTATRTPAPAATNTPQPPTATATPRPTSTLAPSPTAEELDPTPFPPDVNPLTGLQVEDEALLDRIPLAIKVSNSPPARPQSGLGSADLVFEHITEARITRFTAVFYANEPERVGSVRSGRMVDLEIPAMYHALFGYSGSSAGVKELVRRSDLFPDYIAAPDFGAGEPYFYRVPQAGKDFEHTLFASPAALRDLAEEREINERPEFPKHMAFSENIPNVEGIPDITRANINYPDRSSWAQWDYDADSGYWLRTMNGVPHVDSLTGEQIRAANVVLVYANHVNADFWEQMIGAQSSWLLSVEIQLWGQGSALILRDGKMLQGYWQREARDEMLTFVNDGGAPLPLKPGNTWFQVVTLDTETTEENPGEYLFVP
ncbi:MAG: DUF3048 domain-containing protein [Anaerolineae bacterium]|nr:DUF3048 domain-containing protein [Anaerolineae bacterium]